MTAKNNISEDHSSQESNSQLTGKLAWFVYCVEGKIARLPSFFSKLGLSAFETIKKTFTKKNARKMIDKLSLNVPQATDKNIFKMEINALFACFN